MKVDSMFDRWLEFLKKISLVTSLIAGCGLLLLYFCGIATYITIASVLGIEPFPFSLAKCLENGCAFVIQVVVLLPTLLTVGVYDVLDDSSGMIPFLLLMLIPNLVLLVSLSKTKKLPHASRGAVAAGVVSMIIIGGTIGLIYLVGMADLSTPNLLFDPAVNVAIERKGEIEETADFEKYGLTHLNTSALPLIKGDTVQYTQKIGRMLFVYALTVLAAFLALKLSAEIRNRNAAFTPSFNNSLNTSRRALTLLMVVFSTVILFLFVGRIGLLGYVGSRPKVDVSIPGVEVSKTHFLLLAGEDNDRYTFYVPSDQSLLVVPRKNVERFIVKGNISIFADRFHFVKGPWLGMEANWIESIGGYIVTRVAVGSPAQRAGFEVGDIITGIGESRFRGTESLDQIAHQLPLRTKVPFRVDRRTTNMVIEVQPELRP